MRESITHKNARNRLNFLQRIAHYSYYPERNVQLYRVTPNAVEEVIAYVIFETDEEKDEFGTVTKERTYRCFSIDGNTLFKNGEEGEVLTYTQIEERLLRFFND